MEITQKALDLKSKIMDNVQVWSDGLIDSFFQTHHLPVMAKKYIKRGIQNTIIQKDQNITSAINKAMLFIADENGNYDLGMMVDDMISTLKELPETPFDFYGMNGTIGSGVIRLYLPQIPLLSSLFGDIGAIKVTESDFQILKEMLTDPSMGTSLNPKK